MFNMKLAEVAVAVIASALLASTVHAQAGGKGGGGGQRGGKNRDAATQRASPESLLSDQLDAELNDVRAALKLAPNQAAAWQAYEDRVRDLMSDMTQAPASTPAEQNAIQQIGRRVDVVRDRLTALEDVADAAKALYGQLTAEQKTIADQRLAATVPALYSGVRGVSGRPSGAESRKQPRSNSPPKDE